MSDAIGHNNPPTELEILHDALQEKNQDLAAKAAELHKRALEIGEVSSDEAAEDLLNLIAAIKAVERAAKDRGDADKAPINAQWDVVHGFYKKLAEPLAKVRSGSLEPARTKFLTEKAAREKAAREAAAKAAREAAEKAAAEARLREKWAQDEAERKEAAEAAIRAGVTQAVATEVEERAGAAPADLARTRTSMGAMGTLVTTLASRVTDRSTVDLVALRPYISDDAIVAAIREYGRAKRPAIEAALKLGEEYTALAGVQFYYKQTSRG